MSWGSSTRPERKSGSEVVSPVRRCGAVRAHHENEADRIIRIVGAEMKLPRSPSELELLRKGDTRKVMRAAMVKRRTSVKNDWLTSRLRMGHPAAMSRLISQTLKDPKSLKILEKHEKTYKYKD